MKVLILNKKAELIKQTLELRFPDITIHAATDEAEIGDHIEDADILMAMFVSDGLLKRAGKLQWIQSMLTGVDYFLDLPSFKKEVLLTSARGIHGPQMSEMAILHMLNLTRNFPRIMRNQKEKKWERWPQPLLFKKSVGILGVGVIGTQIARKCKTFDMTVYGIVRKKRELVHVDHVFDQEGLIEVMRSVDYFINVVPNTPETKNMIGERELGVMKPTAYLINIGRGETVDEAALILALKKGKIAGAGLDVFCQKPLPEDSPFWDMDNVLVTPQLGGMSDIYAEQVLPLLEENLERFLHGKHQDLVNVVDH